MRGPYEDLDVHLARYGSGAQPAGPANGCYLLMPISRWLLWGALRSSSAQHLVPRPYFCSRARFLFSCISVRGSVHRALFFAVRAPSPFMRVGTTSTFLPAPSLLSVVETIEELEVYVSEVLRFDLKAGL
jgi:hypothetical protein